MRPLIPLLSALLSAALLMAAPAQAQTWPNRTVTLLAPFPPGGPSDATARALQPALQQALGQTVIVENVPGASGSIGVAKFLAAPADGHVLLLGTADNTVLAPLAIASAKYTGQSVRLVSMLSRSYFALVVSPALGVRTMSEFLARVRNPNAPPVNFGSWGIGSMPHLIGEDFKSRTSARMTHIPYKGMGPMVTDIAGGTLDAAFLPLAGNVVSMIDGGQLRALGTTSPTKLAVPRDVAPLREQPGLADFEYSIWPGVFVSPATPEDVVQKLQAALAPIIKGDAFRKFTTDSGGLPVEPQSLSEAATFYNAEIAKFQGIARAIKLQPE